MWMCFSSTAFWFKTHKHLKNLIMAEYVDCSDKTADSKYIYDISVILPVYNAAEWLDECLLSIVDQDFQGSVELSVYNDCSSDSSARILEKWMSNLKQKHIHTVITGHDSGGPKGVGFAKNKAVQQSSGQFLCFLDADDVMMPDRLSLQYNAAKDRPNAIIGSRFYRLPEGSTGRYTKWANSLSQEQLYTQVYTSHGPTVIMPTWFCARAAFEKVGHFDETGKGTPEDIIFFYQFLASGGEVFRVDEVLLMYRYHPSAATFSVKEETIWALRIRELEKQVLSKWSEFTIWNAGKQGRKLFRSLSRENQIKVVAFCDVDAKKISHGYYTVEESREIPKPTIPIIHYTKAHKPFIICVKQDLTAGSFEENLKSLDIREGVEYIHFN